MKYPSYLNISNQEFNRRIKEVEKMMAYCIVCPRKCEVDRLKGEKGFCRLTKNAIVSSYHPHFGEEACLVGKRGSGTIFFSHCNLACVFCQNYDISQMDRGEVVFESELADIMIKLKEMGCYNINFVTPTPNLYAVLTALPIAINRGLDIPLVYNSSGYDSLESLKLLDGIIDIYMPDVKYSDKLLARKYSAVSDYPERMKEAIKEMHRQVGDLEIDENGIAKKGLLIRHLVLPNHLDNSKKIFEFIASEISPNTFINIMDQYRPEFKAFGYPDLAHPLGLKEYQEAVKSAKEAGLRGIYP